jgi:hypothetical protein
MYVSYRLSSTHIYYQLRLTERPQQRSPDDFDKDDFRRLIERYMTFLSCLAF